MISAVCCPRKHCAAINFTSLGWHCGGTWACLCTMFYLQLSRARARDAGQCRPKALLPGCPWCRALLCKADVQAWRKRVLLGVKYRYDKALSMQPLTLLSQFRNEMLPAYRRLAFSVTERYALWSGCPVYL
eukprot:4347134-Amphidinium_carterae.1